MKNPSLKRLYELAGEYHIEKYPNEAKLGNIKPSLAIILDFINFVFNKQSEAKWRKDKVSLTK